MTQAQQLSVATHCQACSHADPEVGHINGRNGWIGNFRFHLTLNGWIGNFGLHGWIGNFDFHLTLNGWIGNFGFHLTLRSAIAVEGMAGLEILVSICAALRSLRSWSA
eukprot:2647347-Amphidinium_carterae.1